MCRVRDSAAERLVVGAQVSYRDRAIAESCGIAVAYLRPHGAPHNRVVDTEDPAAAVLRGLRRPADWCHVTSPTP